MQSQNSAALRSVLSLSRMSSECLISLYTCIGVNTVSEISSSSSSKLQPTNTEHKSYVIRFPPFFADFPQGEQQNGNPFNKYTPSAPNRPSRDTDPPLDSFWSWMGGGGFLHVNDHRCMTPKGRPDCKKSRSAQKQTPLVKRDKARGGQSQHSFSKLCCVVFRRNVNQTTGVCGTCLFLVNTCILKGSDINIVKRLFVKEYRSILISWNGKTCFAMPNSKNAFY